MTQSSQDAAPPWAQASTSTTPAQEPEPASTSASTSASAAPATSQTTLPQPNFANPDFNAATAGIGDLISGAFETLKSRMNQVIRIGLVVGGIDVVAAVFWFLGFLALGRGTATGSFFGFILWVLAYVIFLAGLALEYAALIRIMSPNARETSLSDLLSQSSQYVVPLAAVLFIMSVIVGIGSIVIIGGIVAATFLVFAPQALILDNAGITGSLQESYRLVANDFWSTLVKVFVLGLLLSVVSAVLYVIVLILSVTIIGGPVALGVGTALLTAYAVAYTTMMYSGAKARAGVMPA